MTQITLRAQNLAKSYKSRQVVKDVSLTVKTGQLVGLLGPNGAGKTTTFYMVVGLAPSRLARLNLDTPRLQGGLQSPGGARRISCHVHLSRTRQQLLLHGAGTER